MKNKINIRSGFRNIKDFLAKCWNKYLKWLGGIDPKIVGPAIVGICTIITIVVTIGIAIYVSYQKGERQLVFLHRIVLEQERQLIEYSKLAHLIAIFNEKFSNKYGVINSTDDIITIKGRIHDIEESRLYQPNLDSIMNEFRQRVIAIEQINQKLNKLSKQIHSPWKVKKGDTHRKVSESFLINEMKLSPSETGEILNKTALIWDLEPGNYIYNVYYEGIYLTTVTQGEADISPFKAQARIRGALLKKADEYEMQISILKKEIEELKKSQN